jgi:hypothetical protein
MFSLLLGGVLFYFNLLFLEEGGSKLAKASQTYKSHTTQRIERSIYRW